MDKEYIEREKARELIDNYGKNAVDLGRWSLDPVDDIIALAKGVDKIPSADVVDHKRGEWIKHKPDPKVMDEFHKMGIGKAMNRNSIYWTCSCCGTWGTPTHKFCYECGADMRKED